MSDRTDTTPTPDGDVLLAQVDALHDDEPQRGLELLRALDPATVSTNQLHRLSFLLDHVFGVRFDLWPEALAGQRVVVQRAGALALAARFSQDWLNRWFADRSTRNEAPAAHHGR